MFRKNSGINLGVVLGMGGGDYKTNLISKENHPPLQNNGSSSLGRLRNLTRNKESEKE